MQLPASVDRFEALTELPGPLHLAIGVFDGVHLGHKAVIESALRSADRSGGQSGVLTFDPHPSRLFRPEAPTRLIMDIETKTAVLHAMGVDVVVRKRFDEAFAAIEARDFLRSLKAGIPALCAVYVGENFRFGRKRGGDVETLVETGRDLGVAVFSIDRIKHNGEPISSTRIRRALEAGELETVNDLLGYSLTEVVAGKQLGRTIGFPTLNCVWDPECRPRFGVYLVRFREAAGSGWQAAVANYGVKPTVEDKASIPTLELHALRGTALGTGDRVEAEWLAFLRPECKFDSVDALKVQIAEDVRRAQAMARDG